MTEQDLNPRDRIMLEISRLRKEIFECAHCQAIKEQIVQLVNLLPPDPIYVKILDSGEREILWRPRAWMDETKGEA